MKKEFTMSMYASKDDLIADQNARIAELEDQLAAVQQGFPALYQFQDSDGKWCNFMHEEHYKNTVKDGSWPIRALYTHSTQQGVDAQKLHNDIMNLPREKHSGLSYREGHRDARHAAAELVISAQEKQGGV